MRNPKRSLDTSESCLSPIRRRFSAISCRTISNFHLSGLAERQSQRAKRPHGVDEERHRQCRRLIKDLTLEYNKLRQGNITKELLEIAGGQSRESE